MALRNGNLPRDPDLLIEMVLAGEGKIEALQATIAKLRTIIFGARSEKIAVIIAEQLSLGLGEAEASCAGPSPANDDGKDDKGGSKTAAQTRKRRNRNIGALPKHLPRVDVTIEPETTTCPCCAGALHRIGEDVNEVVDRVPAVLRVLRTIRPKYACRACEGTVVQAKARPRLIESGMASTALVAWIAAAKFAWGSTLYRQAQILGGHGLRVDRQTLARWMRQAAWTVKGLYELQLASMHGHARLFCDETPVRMLDPGRGRTKICQFWAHATDDRSWKGPAPPAVAYVFASGRGKKEIAAQLTGFEGVLHVDGYGAYVSLAGDKKTAGKIHLAFCLVHARRHFVDVLKTTNSPFAKEVVERIAAGLCDREANPRSLRRPAPRDSAGRDEAAHGGIEGAAGGYERWHISPIDLGRSDQLRARTLGRSDAVPGGRAVGAGHEHRRALDPADRHREKE